MEYKRFLVINTWERLEGDFAAKFLEGRKSQHNRNHVATGRYTVRNPRIPSPPADAHTDKPLKPPRPLLQRHRVPKIHHLLPHPHHPIQHDPPSPLPLVTHLSLHDPRHRLRLRSLRRNPITDPFARHTRRTPHLDRLRHQRQHAGRRFRKRRRG